MKATLVIEGKEFPIEINDPELQKLVAPPKKTGYERRINQGQIYVIDRDNDLGIIYDRDDMDDRALYENANYYTDVKLAENNARADNLMRQMRRFAVEHREKALNWRDKQEEKWYIYFDYTNHGIFVNNCHHVRDLFVIYFHSRECAEAAIKEFHDELIWYFTEYKDSL